MTVTPTAPAAARPVNPFEEAFARLAEAEAARQPAWVLAMRKAGLARFGELGFPTLQHEDWRFTNVAPVTRLPFRPQLAPGSVDAARPVLARAPLTGLPGPKLVFVNGHFAPALSQTAPLPAGARAPAAWPPPWPATRPSSRSTSATSFARRTTPSRRSMAPSSPTAASSTCPPDSPSRVRSTCSSSRPDRKPAPPAIPAT